MDYKEQLEKMRAEEEIKEKKYENDLNEYKIKWKKSDNPLLRAFYYYEKIEYFMFFIGSSIIMMLMFLLTAEVIGRYVFNKPIPGQMEFIESLLPVTVLIGLAITQRKYGNVRMDLFLSKAKGKLRKYWEATLQFVTFLIMLPCGIFGTIWFFEQVNLGDRTEQMEIVLWPFKMWIPIGFAMLLIRCLAEGIQWINHARNETEYIHEKRNH